MATRLTPVQRVHNTPELLDRILNLVSGDDGPNHCREHNLSDLALTSRALRQLVTNSRLQHMTMSEFKEVEKLKLYPTERYDLVSSLECTFYRRMFSREDLERIKARCPRLQDIYTSDPESPIGSVRIRFNQDVKEIIRTQMVLLIPDGTLRWPKSDQTQWEKHGWRVSSPYILRMEDLRVDEDVRDGLGPFLESLKDSTIDIPHFVGIDCRSVCLTITQIEALVIGLKRRTSKSQLSYLESIVASISVLTMNDIPSLCTLRLPNLVRLELHQSPRLEDGLSALVTGTHIRLADLPDILGLLSKAFPALEDIALPFLLSEDPLRDSSRLAKATVVMPPHPGFSRIRLFVGCLTSKPQRISRAAVQLARHLLPWCKSSPIIEVISTAESTEIIKDDILQRLVWFFQQESDSVQADIMHTSLLQDLNLNHPVELLDLERLPDEAFPYWKAPETKVVSQPSTEIADAWTKKHQAQLLSMFLSVLPDWSGAGSSLIQAFPGSLGDENT